MSEPVVRQSRNSAIANLYHENAVFEPLTCGSVVDEVESVRRQIKAAERQLRIDLAEIDKGIDGLKYLLTAKVVRDTSRAFVSMAATLLDGITGNKAGNKVKGLMNIAVAEVEFKSGQIDDAKASYKAIDGIIDITMGGPGKKIAKTINNAGRIATSDGKEADAMVTKIVHDNAALTMEFMAKGFEQANKPGAAEGARAMKTIISVHKFSVLYDAKLDAMFDQHVSEREYFMQRKNQIRTAHQKEMNRLLDMLAEALSEFELCSRNSQGIE